MTKIENVIKKEIEKKSIYFYVVIILLIIFLLYQLNYIFAKYTYGGEDFLVNWQAARLLTIKGSNPYSLEAIQQYLKTASDNNILPYEKELHFSDPIFSIIFYLPFSIFSDFTSARAAWLIFQEISAILLGLVIIKLFKWKLYRKHIIVLCCFSLFFFFSLLNLLDSTILIFLNLIMILIIYLLVYERYEIAGLLFSLLIIQYRVFLFPILATAIFIARKKAWSFLIWFIISFLFMIIVSLFFIPGWPLQYIKELFDFPRLANLQLPGVALREWLPDLNPTIGNLMFLLTLTWVIVEVTLTKPTINSLYWSFAFSLTLSQVAWIRNDLNGFVVLLFPFFFIFHQWYLRNKKIGIPIIFLSINVFTVGLYFISNIKDVITLQEPAPFYMNLIGPIFLLLNLYWMRWWIFKNQIIEI